METRREVLNVSILQEQLQKPRFTKEQIVAWISRFKYGDPNDLEYQKQIIDTFVNSVYVYDDRLVMTYNYKDGTETISLDAVHQAFGSDLSSDAPRNRVHSNSVFSCLFWPPHAIINHHPKEGSS